MEGDDRPTGGAEGDWLVGGPGDDRIAAGGGTDDLTGGAGDDLLEGGAGTDELTGGDGADRLAGGPGRDQLHGGTGQDAIDGGDGGDGKDLLTGGGLADRLRGGRGDDRVKADSDFFADEVDCGDGRDEAALDHGDHPHGCERAHRDHPGRRPVLVARFGRGPRPGGPVYDVAGGQAHVTLCCLDLGVHCDARVVARVRRGRRWVTVFTAMLRCDARPAEPFGECDSAAAEGTRRLTRAGRRLLRGRARLPARAVIHLAPGAARGAIALHDRLVLRAAPARLPSGE